MGQVGPSNSMMGLDSSDNSTWRHIKVDTQGNLLVKTDVDLSADIEIDGTPVEQRGYQITSSGDNTVITTTAGKRLKIYRIAIYPSADITGDVQIKLGSLVISRPYSPKAGAMYGFNNQPNYSLGALGDNLVINLPSATTTNVDVCWEEVDG